MQQPEITKFFSLKSKIKMSLEDNSDKTVGDTSVSRFETSRKRRCEMLIQAGELPELSCNANVTISLLSSDEENNSFNSPVKRPPKKVDGISPISVKSETSSQRTPVKSGGSIQGPGTSGNSSGGNRKFYSPTKKRSIQNTSPHKRLIAGSMTPKKLFVVGDDILQEACNGQDDKTKFMLHSVYNVTKHEKTVSLLSDRIAVLLRQFLRLRGVGARLVTRLYWRKARWYRHEEIINIIKEDIVHQDAILQLLDSGFLTKGSSDNMDLEDFFTTLLKQEDLKNICKNLKLKGQTKKEAAEQLRSYCRRSNITSYFTQQNGDTATNEAIVFKHLQEAAGDCYRLSEDCRAALERATVLSHLGLDPEVLRSRTLELLLINVKSGREAFPVVSSEDIDTPDVVFKDMQAFEDYMLAQKIYENFLQSTDSKEKISIVQQAFSIFKDIDINVYSDMPSWLHKFTSAYSYMRIIEEGLPELKKGADESLCRSCVSMLRAMLDQNVLRQHHRAVWYNEMALILHKYLLSPTEAAEVLLEGLNSALREEDKDLLRTRANMLATQKNIELSKSFRNSLLEHGNTNELQESSLPCQHFHKQAMENEMKSKVLFESKHEDGSRTISSVENVAICFYIASGEYTYGRHYEGRIITTIFFLLFWDVIYSRSGSARGVFLSPYQRYPLDLFSDRFYENRRTRLEERLRDLRGSTMDQIVQRMLAVWTQRPECEQNGINRDIGWDCVVGVCRCVGVSGLVSVCERLAHHYRYAHSGFPDLTLWHHTQNKVKFAEVKSDSDKSSLKQIQWIQYLLANGIDAEICYVGTKRTKK